MAAQSKAQAGVPNRQLLQLAVRGKGIPKRLISMPPGFARRNCGQHQALGGKQ